jgi:ferrochelatase
MAFSPEPIHTHGTAQKSAVLLVNLGTPDAPQPQALRAYLGEFLSDPRVIEIPRLLAWLLLHLLVIPWRAPRSAAKYASVWMKEGSPLRVYTERQAKLLRGTLGAQGRSVLVEWGMRYGTPSIAQALDALKAAGAERILVLPLYPQYSATTTASGMDAIAAWCARTRNIPELRFVKHYHDHPAYIGALAERIKSFWEVNGPLASGTAGKGPQSEPSLLFSFHGIPRRSLLLGDPYYCECQTTGRLLRESLGLSAEVAQVTFQSRFGKAEWLKPYTEPTLRALAEAGVAHVDICCPGFPADCLETLEEIAMEGKAAFLGAGGTEYRYIPCLNDWPGWIDALARIALEHMAGWPTTVPSPSEQEELKRRREHALAKGAST